MISSSIENYILYSMTNDNLTTKKLLFLNTFHPHTQVTHNISHINKTFFNLKTFMFFFLYFHIL